MKVFGRVEAAKRLDMSPHALSCHVSQANWDKVPQPIQIGGRYKWTDTQITEWINEKLEKVMNNSTKKVKRRGPGRPPKTRSATCP